MQLVRLRLVNSVFLPIVDKTYGEFSAERRNLAGEFEAHVVLIRIVFLSERPRSIKKQTDGHTMLPGPRGHAYLQRHCTENLLKKTQISIFM